MTMTETEIGAFDQRASQNESLLGRSLTTAGVTWPGVLLWDGIRALDYLASRPEVDARRLGCVGLSVGGYRSFLLAALDERIRVAVDVGWMTSFASQIKQHAIRTIGLSFHVIGLYRYLDLPDLAALIAPRAALVINGSQDRLFNASMGSRRRLKRSRAATPRRVCPRARSAASTTRPTNSTWRCRPKPGDGSNAGCNGVLPMTHGSGLEQMV